MPTLDWIGKKAVEKHHEEVPFHLLKCDNSLSVGDPGSGNLIVQGDNLVALKALLPYYAGKVKCIYIDPPYNTGNEKWVYNDSVNSPEIKEWLGNVVGSESEDLSRHDKWLCMMLPRLNLLYKLLSKDGFLFASLDDNEIHNLKPLLNTVFGESSFVAQIIVQSNSRGQTYQQIPKTHEYLLCYAKTAEAKINEVQGERQDILFVDDVGEYSIRELRNRNPKFGRFNRPNLFYPIYVNPQLSDESGFCSISTSKDANYSIEVLPLNSAGAESCWRWGKALVDKSRLEDPAKSPVVAKKRRDGGWNIYDKYRKLTVKMKSIWQETEMLSEQGTVELRELGLAEVFQHPKPVALIKRVIELGATKDAIILDSFAGSGTTAHAVLQLNKEDGGNRKFILVEMDENICQNITTERVKRVAEGYKNQKGEQVAGLGGGFRYCTLGETLFDADGEIRKEVKFSDLARHIYLTETGEPLPKQNNGRSPLLGVHHGTAYYLLYNGILGDKTPQGGNVLTRAVLAELPEHDGPKVVFGTGCRLGKKRLDEMRTQFRQIPGKVVIR